MCVSCSSLGYHYFNWCSRRAHQNQKGQDLCSCSQQHAIWSKQHKEMEDGLWYQREMGKSFDGLGINVSTLNIVFRFSVENTNLFIFSLKKTLTFLRANMLVKISFSTVRFTTTENIELNIFPYIFIDMSMCVWLIIVNCRSTISGYCWWDNLDKWHEY